MSVPAPDLRLAAPIEVEAYEDRLAGDWPFAQEECDRFFAPGGGPFETLRRFAVRLDELGVPYAAAGGPARFRLGARGITPEVSVLLPSDRRDAVAGLADGQTYRRKPGGRLIDSHTGVSVLPLFSGRRVGGANSPLTLPEPHAAAELVAGIPYVRLEPLMEWTLAEGMRLPARTRARADASDLILARGLPAAFGGRLAPYVRAEYLRLWNAIDAGRVRES